MSDYRQELELIRVKNKGLLRPHDVVKFARDPKTALHKKFTWDNTKAAEEYRLWEARTLIRVAVIVEENTSEEVRAYVSITDSRGKEGGYYAIAEILDNKALTARMLQDALNDLNLFRDKYNSIRKISDINPVFLVIDDIIPTKVKKVKGRRG